ncbi:MAG: DUF1538 domain-containing protein [Bacilli bacterium]
MKNLYLKAFLTSCLSILPMIGIVIILSLTGLTPLPSSNYPILLVGALVLIVGLALFQIGASSSLSKVGEYMGSSLSKQKNIWIIIIFSFILGALITCAEPSIIVVSEQVNINKFLLIGSIAVGVGIFVVIGIIRIIIHGSLKVWYLFFYAITFMLIILCALNNPTFLPFIFDSGGITTGSATVPFILSLGAGVAIVRGGKNSTNDSFGLVGMASIGPIFTMTLLIILNKNISGYFEFAINNPQWSNFIKALLPSSATSLGSLIEVLMAILPILVIFFIYELIFIKLPRRKVLKLLTGFAFTYVGLVLFLTAVSAVMNPIGGMIGSLLGKHEPIVIILICFGIGLLTILCEPAVHVLTGQIEAISDGRIKKRTVLITLSIGVGLAIMLSAIRVIYNFSIMYYMVPGYIISLVLMFFCNDIYTAFAFDSGGTASGPMSVSFVLPLILGVTFTLYGESADYYSTSFGVVALIALTPIIGIQLLGMVEKVKEMKIIFHNRKIVYDQDDNQIIHF